MTVYDSQCSKWGLRQLYKFATRNLILRPEIKSTGINGTFSQLRKFLLSIVYYLIGIDKV